MIPAEVYIVGAGGHGKVIAGALRELGIRVDGFLDDTKAIGSKFAGSRVIGKLDFVASLRVMPMIIGIGGNRDRCRVADDFSARGEKLVWVTAVHPRAWVATSACLGAGSFVAGGASVSEDVKIGKQCIINTNASIDHDCTLGDFVHVACGATIAGGVSIGDGALIGAGATVLPGHSIGAWSIVGAGATVTRDVMAKTMVVGVPARPFEVRN